MKGLTMNEERVLNVIGEVAINGHPNTSSSSVAFSDMEVTVANDLLDHTYHIPKSPIPIYSETSELSLDETDITASLGNKENTRINCLMKTSCVMPETLPNESFVINTPHKENIPKTKGKKTVRTIRLDNSIRASERLAEYSKIKIEMKKQYYNSKLKLLQESIEVQKDSAAIQQRITTALEKIAEAMK